MTVKWFREGAPVKELAALETRVTIRKDGSLIINPVIPDDSGQYLCEVSNGIGEPQSASAYLDVECKISFLGFSKILYIAITLISSSCPSNFHPHYTISAVSIGRRDPVLHQGEPANAVRHVDERQTRIGAISDQGRRRHEQRLVAVH